MHRNNNSSIGFNYRDRGLYGAVPILLILLLSIFAIAGLCGCENKDAELILLEDTDGKLETQEKASVNAEIVSDAAAKVTEDYNEYVEANVIKEEQDTVQIVYIYVCGAVNCPDVYELNSDKHVVDGIKAAGGFAENADRDAVNLAERVVDGMKIYVPVVGENVESKDLISVSAPSRDQYANGVSNSLININTATKEQLMTLPGIGEGKAVKIIEYRENNGPFLQNSDIMNVNGIKDGAYSKIKDFICVG